MSFELWQYPCVPLQFQVETGLLLRCDRDFGIPFPTKQGIRPSSLVKEGKTRLFLRSGRKLSIPLEWGWVSWEASRGFIKGVNFPFEFQEGTWDFLGNTAA